MARTGWMERLSLLLAFAFTTNAHAAEGSDGANIWQMLGFWTVVVVLFIAGISAIPRRQIRQQNIAISSKSKAATILYQIAFAISMGNALLILYFLLSERFDSGRIGDYLVPYFIVYGAITCLIWCAAFLTDRNWKWTACYYFSILCVLALFRWFRIV